MLLAESTRMLPWKIGRVPPPFHKSGRKREALTTWRPKQLPGGVLGPSVFFKMAAGEERYSIPPTRLIRNVALANCMARRNVATERKDNKIRIFVTFVLYNHKFSSSDKQQPLVRREKEEKAFYNTFFSIQTKNTKRYRRGR